MTSFTTPWRFYSTARIRDSSGARPGTEALAMQLRYRADCSCKDYISLELWREARLGACPGHPEGGCGLHRNGHYFRKTPFGPAPIARFRCPQSGATFSLLPDFFAARMPGTLAEIESAADCFERGGSSLEAARAARGIGRTVEDGGMRRWARLRLAAALACIAAAITIFPDELGGCACAVFEVRARLGCECALTGLRRRFEAHLQTLPAPLGFAARASPGRAE